MRWKLSLIVAILIGGLAGSWIKNLPGFIIIAIDKTSYEMRLWVATCLVLIIVAVLFLLGALVRALLSQKSKVSSWRSGRSWKKSRKKTIAGMLAFTEGRWKAAEDAMTQAAVNSDTKLINYLIAAQAAQHQNAEVRRDAYLRQASQAEPAAKVAIGLTQAQLQLQHNQLEQALASLNKLKENSPEHPYVLKLLSRLYQRLQDHERLLELLPLLKKQRVFDSEQLIEIERQAIAGILTHQADLGGIEKLQDYWLKLPTASRKLKENILTYANHLILMNHAHQAEALLRPLFKKQADTSLINLYGEAISQDPGKQLQFLQSWKKSQSLAPKEIYLTLGKIAYAASLWGQARQFLEEALQYQPTAQAYWYMAKCLQNLDDPDHAADCHRQGLEFAANIGEKSSALKLEKGSEDLVNNSLLPKFQKIES